MIKQPSILIFFLGIFLFACKDIKKEKSLAISFYENLQKKDYDKIIPSIDTSVLGVTSKGQWKDLFAEKNKEFGNITKFENTASYFHSKDELKITKLKFKVDFEKVTLFETLEFQTIGTSNPKITHYEYSEKDFEIPEDY